MTVDFPPIEPFSLQIRTNATWAMPGVSTSVITPKEASNVIVEPASDSKLMKWVVKVNGTIIY